MSKKYPCIETTIDIYLGEFLLRLWINQEEVPNDYRNEEKLVEKIKQRFEEDWSHINEVLEFSAELPKVNAAQIITDREGNTRYGTVVYTVDLGSDVHG